MKCPNCGNRNQIAISNGSGYSQDIRECGACGTAWTFVGDELVVFD